MTEIEDLNMVRPMQVLFRGMGDSALNLEARIWIDVYADRELMLDRVNVALYNALNDAEIEIPFPQQTVWHRFENGMSLTNGEAARIRVQTSSAEAGESED